MAVALDLLPLQESVRDDVSVVVGTEVVEGEELALELPQHDLLTLHLDQLQPVGRDLFTTGNLHETFHLKPPRFLGCFSHHRGACAPRPVLLARADASPATDVAVLDG